MRAALLAVAALSVLHPGCRGREDRPAPAPSPTPAPVAATTAADPWAVSSEIAPLPPPDVTEPFPRPFLWRADKDGHTTYLFGTVHAGLDGERRIPRWVWAVFEAAPALIEETDIHDSVGISAWTVRPPGPSLREELGPADWAQLEQALSPGRAALVDRQATAVAALQLSGYGGGGRDNAAPMDGALLLRAKGLGKRLVFLEDVREQGAIFASLFDADTVRLLLANRAELPRLNRAFFDAYLEGDEDAVYAFGVAQLRLQEPDDAARDRLVEKLLLTRNRAWIPQLEAAHAAGGGFVAAGVLHFAGPDNVLALLRARGFTVQRVETPSH